MKKIKCKKVLKKTKPADGNALLLKQQAERISELKSENETLNNALEKYREREREVVDAVEFARKKGDEYVTMIRIKYALECERIKRFKERLEKFRSREELLKCYDTAYGELNAWIDEMEKNMANDFGNAMSDYLSEKRRLKEEPSVEYASLIGSDGKDELTDLGKLSEEDLRDLLEQL